jgi:hypothetical protein
MILLLTVARASCEVVCGYEGGAVWLPFIERLVSDGSI